MEVNEVGCVTFMASELLELHVFVFSCRALEATLFVSSFFHHNVSWTPRKLLHCSECQTNSLAVSLRFFCSFEPLQDFDVPFVLSQVVRLRLPDKVDLQW